VSEPDRYRVADLIAAGVLAVGDGYRAKNQELGAAGLPFCRAGNVQQGFDFAGADRFPEVRLSRVGDKISRPGDVVFTSKGTVGRFARVRPDTEKFVYSPQLCYWRSLDPSRIDPTFLYFWMSGPAFRAQFKAVAGQTDMADYVSLGDQRSMWIDLPDITRQRQVGGVLGALDDKIELNQRLATTLEALGRFTYRHWRETLPTTDFRPIGDVCRVLSGGTPSSRREDLWAGPLPWISPKVMTSIHCDEPDERVSPAAIGQGTRLAPAGSTLVMVRGMGLHERVRVSQAREDVTFNQDVKCLTPGGLEPAMLLFSVLDAQDDLLARVESSGHGTGVLPTAALAEHVIAAPPANVRRAVSERLELLNARIGVARFEARTLASFRDALLPRLLGRPEMP
jgi:type I restriction enzyme, S subunit